MAAAKKGKKHPVFIKILLGINLLFMLCLVCAYLAPYISPEKYWILAFFGLSYPVWLVINLVFLVLWIILWKKYAWIVLLVLLLGFNHLISVYPLPFSDRTLVPAGSFKVMTYNVHSLYGITNKENSRGIRSKVTDFLTAQAPDILCIQEFFVRSEDSSKVLSRFTREIGSTFFIYKNYQEMKDKRKINALAIFSKYPIIGSGSLRLGNQNVFSVFADILINHVRVRVYNLHLESIRFGNEDYSFYAHLTEKESESSGFSAGSLKIFSKLKKAFVLRAEQVDMLRKEMDQSPYPVLVCGDFNDSPSSYTYHMLSRNLKDSFIHAGKGLFGNTYAGNLPSFRIDYMLYGKNFEANNYQRIKVDLSDHYPLSAYFRLVNPD
jgi:endonuclease/exonuclease/phosphatase family metal-dependent hydrolase